MEFNQLHKEALQYAKENDIQKTFGALTHKMKKVYRLPEFVYFFVKNSLDFCFIKNRNETNYFNHWCKQ